MATVSVQEPLPISQLNGLRLSEEENNPEIETKLENVEINQNVKNESKPSSVLSSSPQPSTPTSGKGKHAYDVITFEFLFFLLLLASTSGPLIT